MEKILPNKGFESLNEIARSAVWTLSSAKSGSGIEQLLDQSTDLFWQSDGGQIHYLTIQFEKKVNIQYICLFLKHQIDESYTPQKITVRIGSIWNDMVDQKYVEFDKPDGWQVVELKTPDGTTVRGSMLQIVVVSNHKNGRDTRIRGVKIYGPVKQSPDTLDYPEIDFKEEIRNSIGL